MHETFWSLLHNAAHWEFELLFTVLFDGVIAGLVWPWAKRHITHHLERDTREGR